MKRTKKNKLIGKFVTEKLSGKPAIITKKKGKKYELRVWVVESCNWFMMECPKSQFTVGIKESKKMGFK